jgi:hypothetical protein
MERWLGLGIVASNLRRIAQAGKEKAQQKEGNHPHRKTQRYHLY